MLRISLYSALFVALTGLPHLADAKERVVRLCWSEKREMCDNDPQVWAPCSQPSNDDMGRRACTISDGEKTRVVPFFVDKIKQYKMGRCGVHILVARCQLDDFKF